MAIHVVNKKTGGYAITLKPIKRTSAPASDPVISWLGDLKMAVHVVNKKTGGRGDYIGRPSVFGNPFVIGRDGSRADVIRKYRTWFWEQVEAGGALAKAFAKLVDRARAGEDIHLVCWCAPLACHGDVIKQAIEDELRLDRERTAAEISANTQ